MIFGASSMRIYLTLSVFFVLSGCVTLPEPSPSPTNYTSENINNFNKNLSVVIIPMKPIKEFNNADNIIHAKIANTLSAANSKASLLDLKNYHELWREEVNKIGGVYDKVTGQKNKDAYYKALSNLAINICSEAKCDLILIPNVIIKSAKFKGSYAEWDGVRQPIKLNNPNHSDIRMKGSVSALSLEVIAISSNGELIFKKTIGLTLPFETNVKQVQSELRKDIFSDDAEITYAVNQALIDIIK